MPCCTWSLIRLKCSEQLASRILAVAALRDVLTAFKADGLPAPEEMEAAVARDIKRLQGMQNYDGGFPYWRRGFESIPFNTIHVAHALIPRQPKRLRRAGGDAAERSELPARYRIALPLLVQPADPLDLERLCPVCAQPGRRPRCCKRRSAC